jgi:molybdopterin molybdotransferase
MVAPREAIGRVLAESITAAVASPPYAVALRDGWAVAAGDVVGASSYATIFPAVPPPWIEAGERLPPGTDAVLPPDSLSEHAGLPEIVATVAPGEGVRQAGAEAGEGAALRQGGERVRPVDAAIALAAGINRLHVRAATVRLVSLPGAAALDATGELVERLLDASGASVARVRLPSREATAIADALKGEDTDLLVAIGGTGFGRADHAAEALAAAGSLIAHGVALRPGETAGCGVVGAAPVILVPGRFDAALAATLCIVLPCLRHLTDAAPPRPSVAGPLTRKIASAVGLTEITLLRRSGQGLEPLAVADLTLAAVGAAEAWLAVPAESEGFAAGETVAAFWL